MFEDLIEEMERMNGQSVSADIESDEKGYIDKQCPNLEKLAAGIEVEYSNA